MSRTVILITAWIAIGNVLGCGSMRFSAPKGMTVHDAYSRESSGPKGLRVNDVPSPTARRKIVPLMRAPQGFAVYVPQHADHSRRMWIGDHWIYIELTAGGFFAEEVREGVPSTHKTATETDVERLKSALSPGLNKIAIPYRRK